MAFFSSLSSIFKKKSTSAIVYYGKDISYEKVSFHNYIIVQASNIDTSSKEFLAYKKKMYAYVSICEISTQVKEYSKIQQEWILSKNEMWNSLVLDIKNLQYQDFLFNEIIEPLHKNGFENFFFDTLDSYHMVAKSEAEKKSYELKIIRFIKEFSKRFPDAKLIINRGFEIIDEVHNLIEALLFESYYFGLGPVDEPYRKITAKEREWLNHHLVKAKYYGLNIIAVDYLDEKEFDKAHEAIKIIKKNKMIPYVSNRNLDIYGVWK